jgi:hypothetical protein
MVTTRSMTLRVTMTSPVADLTSRFFTVMPAIRPCEKIL